MTQTFNVQEAKTRLSELLRRVEAGEEVVIARAGRPVAILQPVSPPKRAFDHPLLEGLLSIDTEAFLEPMSEEELNDWEADFPTDPLREGLGL